MKYLEALKQARDTYARRNNMDRQQKVDAAVALGEWGVFSNRHVAAFTGLNPAFVNEIVTKPARTGGRLTPQALVPAIEIIWMQRRSELDINLVRKALDAGISVNFLAKLTDIPQRTVARWADRAYQK